VSVEVAVGQRDEGAFGGDRGERDLDLAGLDGVGLDLTLGRDVPGEYDAFRWFRWSLWLPSAWSTARWNEVSDRVQKASKWLRTSSNTSGKAREAALMLPKVSVDAYEAAAAAE
jgi:hypothetical protein